MLKSHRAKLILALTLWALFFLLSIGAVLSYHFFVVQAVTCTIGSDVCPDYIQAELEKSSGIFLFSPKLTERAHKIITHVPSLKNVHVTRQLPHSLIVQYQKALPLYILRSDNSTTTPRFIVDESGMVVSLLQPEQPETQSLPEIVFPEAYFATLNEKSMIDGQLHQAVNEVLTQLKEEGISPTKMQVISQEEIRLEFADGKSAQLPTSNSTEAVMKLGVILRSLDKLSLKEPIRLIDLRFKYPILKTAT